VELSPEDIAMLKGLNFAHLVTLNPDGGPHSTPLWIDVDVEGHVIVNSAVGRRKDRNIRRDPRVALSLQPQDDPYTWMSIQGAVVSIETGDEAEVHIDTLNRRYHDGEAWTYVPGQQRVIYRIRADKVLRSD
jgi:PPOX class probable F420-dependent enzyme